MSLIKVLQRKIFCTARLEAFKGGWNRVKLYFMLGLPTETEDDIERYRMALQMKVAKKYYEIPKSERQRNGKCRDC